MIDKLTIAVLIILYVRTGDTFYPAWAWYAVAALHVIVFGFKLGEWLSSKLEVRLK